jgi:LysR family transcriptional regulator, nitrogen assimilation regulatory protein
LDLRQLRSFVAIARAGSLSKASKQLHIAQPALSHKVAALERELETQLFVRGNRGMKLTRDGLFLLEQATNILKNVNDAVAGLKLQDVSIAGKVRIGLPGTASEIIGSILIRKILKLYPNVFLNIIEDGANELRVMLEQDRLDLAILVNEREQTTLEIVPLAVEVYCLFGPLEQAGETTTIDWTELSKLPLFLSSTYNISRKFIDDTALANGITLSPVAELGSTHLLKNAVRAGLGFTILPWSAANLEFDARTFWIRRIVRPELRAYLGLAASKLHVASRAQQAVKLVILETCRELISDGRWKAEAIPPPTESVAAQ